MPSVDLSVALSQARTFLNDTNATLWTDANLIPAMQQADQELQLQLWNIGSPVVRGMTNPILVPSGYDPDINSLLPTDFLTPTIGVECGVITAVLTQVAVSGSSATYSYSSASGTGTPQLPAAGMIVSISGFTTVGNNVSNAIIVSATGGASGSFVVTTTTQANETHAGSASMTDNVFVDLTEQFFLTPGTVLSTTLVYWAWREEAFVFNGSTVSRYVIFQYRRQIPIPAANTDPIGITFGEMYLGARGAAIAAGSVGNAAAAQILDAIAKENFNMVIMANRGQQKPINKP